MSDMYGIGDYVYFDIAPRAPFLIGKIRELAKTCEGSVEVKVQCYFRRRDLPEEMIALAEKNICDLEKEKKGNLQKLNEIQRHQVKQRELFLSYKTEKLAATQIRGKCHVSLLIDTESFTTYLQKEDTFFYYLIYEQVLKPVRKNVRVGVRYQAEIPSLRETESERNQNDFAIQIWNPRNQLTDLQIDQFLLLCRSVGTFARAVDRESAERSPLLLMTAAFSSRDLTLFHALNILHRSNYNCTQAIDSLIPSGSPLLCRDELEEWTASEANIFEEALVIHGKHFGRIRENMLPWKTLMGIIEYYYMWKTSKRYLDYKERKNPVGESYVNKVCVPLHMAGRERRNKRNAINKWTGRTKSALSCLSCSVTYSGQWFEWSSENSMVCRDCWSYWKRYGGLKPPGGVIRKKVAEESPIRSYLCRFSTCYLNFNSKLGLARHYAREHGVDHRYIMSSRNVYRKSSFYLRTTPMSRISRRFCNHIVQLRHAARRPFTIMNLPLIKQACHNNVLGRTPEELRKLMTYNKKKRDNVAKVVSRLHSILSSKH